MKIEIKSPTANDPIKNPNIAIQGIMRIPHAEFKTVQHYLQYHLKSKGEEVVRSIALPSSEQWTKAETEFVKTFRIPVKLLKETETISVGLYRSGEDAPLASDKVTLKRKYVAKRSATDDKKGTETNYEIHDETRSTGDSD